MKILYFFQELSTPMFQWQRLHLIDELERNGHEVEVLNPLLYKNPEEANEVLCNMIDTNTYDLFFTNICYYKMLFGESLDYIHSKGIPAVCLRCDNLVIPYNDKELAPKFDLVWLTSIETQPLYKKWGAKTIFLPYAANPVTFAPTNNTSINRVCFIGTPYGSRSIMINTLTSAKVELDLYYGGNKTKSPSTFTPKFEIITPSKYSVHFSRLKFAEGRKLIWGTLVNKFRGQTQVIDNEYLHRFPSVSVNGLSSYYSRYNLCLASTSTNHTDALKNPLKIVNLRNFEIPMSGGIEICKFNPELAEYFEADKEIIFYESKEELIDKAVYYTKTASAQEICTIKINARKRAESDHTWMRRFELIFKKLGIKIK